MLYREGQRVWMQNTKMVGTVIAPGTQVSLIKWSNWDTTVQMKNDHLLPYNPNALD